MTERAKTTKQKTGRPARRAGERLAKNRTFRVRGTLDDQLVVAAAASGRSISEEIERRLEDSFQPPFDPRFTALFRLLSGAFGMLDDERAGPEIRNEQYRLLTMALARALNEVAPDFYSIGFTVGDANTGPGKTYTEFANETVRGLHQERVRANANPAAGSGRKQ